VVTIFRIRIFYNEILQRVAENSNNSSFEQRNLLRWTTVLKSNEPTIVRRLFTALWQPSFTGSSPRLNLLESPSHHQSSVLSLRFSSQLDVISLLPSNLEQFWSVLDQLEAVRCIAVGIQVRVYCAVGQFALLFFK